MAASRAGEHWCFVAAPKAWPALPREVSVSTLSEIESCPRRWALNSAEYPELWGRRGYPPRLSVPSLTGSVIHLTLQTITKALARAGCDSLQHEDAVQVMRSLGGYTKVINNCIERILQRFASNPRASPMMEIAVRTLQSRIPEMRAQVQTLLGRIKLQKSSPLGVLPDQGGRPRTPLGPGTYPELELRVPRIGWHGVADLLLLSNNSCSIVDFKTGEPDDSHRFQLRVYALLWSRDVDLNPAGRKVDRLTLSYRD
jgi:hypothetical protein